jgi:hypothetical protein
VNLEPDLSTLTVESVLKLAYVLVRSKTNKTEHISTSIASYVSQHMSTIEPNTFSLFYIYLTVIEGGKSLHNLTLMKQMKERVVEVWEQLTPINKIRSL